MALGPGKYDDALTDARERCKALGAILIVIDGEHGSGFSCQASAEVILMLPSLLRQLANDIEADTKP